MSEPVLTIDQWKALFWLASASRDAALESGLAVLGRQPEQRAAATASSAAWRAFMDELDRLAGLKPSPVAAAHPPA